MKESNSEEDSKKKKKEEEVRTTAQATAALRASARQSASDAAQEIASRYVAHQGLLIHPPVCLSACNGSNAVQKVLFLLKSKVLCFVIVR